MQVISDFNSNNTIKVIDKIQSLEGTKLQIICRNILNKIHLTGKREIK